jgi:integrase
MPGSIAEFAAVSKPIEAPIDDLEARWKLHLEQFFGALRAMEVTSQLVARYIDARQQERAENATINRELAALKRMFNLARQSTPPKVQSAPYTAMLRENNIRTGFLESKQHDSLAAETGKVGLWLRAMFETGYTYGWRYEELLALRVRRANLVAGTIRLEPGTTKNSEGREVSMTLPVRTLLTQCVHGKSPDDYVAEGVIMKIGGWRTRSVFERYVIVSQSDIRDAMTKLEAGQQRDNAEAAQEQNAAQKQFGQGLGKIEPMSADSHNNSLPTTQQVN